MAQIVHPDDSGRSILIVDDDPILCERLGRALRERGYRVRTAANYDDGMTWAKMDRPDFAVVDLRIPGPSGLELASDLRKLHPAITILLLTGLTMPRHPKAEIAYLRKPVDADEILAALGLA